MKRQRSERMGPGVTRSERKSHCEFLSHLQKLAAVLTTVTERSLAPLSPAYWQFPPPPRETTDRVYHVTMMELYPGNNNALTCLLDLTQFASYEENKLEYERLRPRQSLSDPTFISVTG